MKTFFYKISKNAFLKSIKFKNKIDLIRAVKLDWNRSLIVLNKTHYGEFYDFLEKIKTDYNDYLEIILLLSNQCAHFYNYNKIFSIISDYDFHFSTKSDNLDATSKIYTAFTINPLIKQAIIKNTYNIYKVEKSVKIYRILKITTIINLCINNPIVLKLEFIDV